MERCGCGRNDCVLCRFQRMKEREPLPVRSESTGSVSRRVYSRVSEECGKCKDRSVAKDTLRWVLDVIREEQNRGIGGKHLSTYDQGGA